MRARDTDGIRVVRRNRFEQTGARDDRQRRAAPREPLRMVGANATVYTISSAPSKCDASVVS